MRRGTRVASALHSFARMRGWILIVLSCALAAVAVGCRPPNGPGLTERMPTTTKLATYRSLSIEILTNDQKLDDPQIWGDWQAQFITFQDELIAEARASHLGVTIVEPKARAELRLRIFFHEWTAKRYRDTPIVTGGRRSGIRCSIELIDERETPRVVYAADLERHHDDVIEGMSWRDELTVGGGLTLKKVRWDVMAILRAHR